MVTIAEAAATIGATYGPLTQHYIGECSDVFAQPLLDFAERVGAADDEELVSITASSIHASANMSRFRGMASVHAEESIASAECDRRHRAAGHTSECRGSTLRRVQPHRAGGGVPAHG